MIAEATRSVYAHTVEEDAVVVMGVYLMESIQKYREQFPGRKLVIYQLEPIALQSHTMWRKEDVIRHLHEADEVWDYDLSNIQYLREELGIHAFYRPFLFSEACCKYVDPTKEKDLGVLFFGYYTERRSRYIYEFHKYCGYSFAWLTHVQHPELDDYVSRAKVIINVHHAENLPQQEQTRLFYLLSNGKDVVSERCKYNIYGDLIQEVDTPEEMADAVHKLLETYDPLREQHRKYMFKNLTYDDVYRKFSQE